MQAVLAQHGTDRLNSPSQPTRLASASVHSDELHNKRKGRSSSAPKKAAAAFSIPFARLSSAFSLFNRLTSAESSLVTPGRRPASTSG